jgi:hypothetical protein
MNIILTKLFNQLNFFMSCTSSTFFSNASLSFFCKSNELSNVSLSCLLLLLDSFCTFIDPTIRFSIPQIKKISTLNQLVSNVIGNFDRVKTLYSSAPSCVFDGFDVLFHVVAW